MPGSSQKRPHGGRNREDPLDRRISELACRQHLVVALRQLVALGLSASAVRGRVAAGRLHAVHRAVVAIVPPPALAPHGRIMAAVLACRAGSAASFRAAALLMELRSARRRWIDVTTPGSHGRDRGQIRVHSGMTLAPGDVTTVDGVPCTTFARTLLDLAEDADERELERAVDRAEQRRIFDLAAIDDVLDRANGRRGAARLRALLAGHRVAAPTRNDLEEAFLRIARGIGRAPDGVNHWIAFAEGGGAEADFIWLGERLVVEVDGRDVHTTRRAFEHDRRRDQRLALLGLRVVRFSWRQVTAEPRYVAATLDGLLGARSMST